jgi:phosphate-selective porin
MDLMEVNKVNGNYTLTHIHFKGNDSPNINAKDKTAMRKKYMVVFILPEKAYVTTYISKVFGFWKIYSLLSLLNVNT